VCGVEWEMALSRSTGAYLLASLDELSEHLVTFSLLPAYPNMQCLFQWSPLHCAKRGIDSGHEWRRKEVARERLIEQRIESRIEDETAEN